MSGGLLFLNDINYIQNFIGTMNWFMPHQGKKNFCF